ncbi:MAG: sulfatase-like hydrolase/transferase, partial [Isosphaeraceae bacterium]
MRRRTLGLSLLATALGGLSASSGAADRPNVLVIVSDDHGLELGCYGHPVLKTPHLDRLAAEGTRFRNAFCTTASCSASRSVLLTGLHNHANGQYGHQHSVHHFSAFGTVKSLPVILAEHGYRTARVGKYHVAPESVFAFQTKIPAPGGARHTVRMAEACREFVADRSSPFFLYYATADPHRG